jgi:hypothetical protein
MNNKLLTASELAFELRKSVKYIYAMRKRGFLMPGGVATVAEARAWLVRNPAPTRRNGTKIEPERLQGRKGMIPTK